MIKLLNHALATEIVCVLRYKCHYYMASGINSQAIKAEFLEHANEEQGHADLIAERITQLDGKPNLLLKACSAAAIAITWKARIWST